MRHKLPPPTGCRKIRFCHAEFFACHPERSEGSPAFAQNDWLQPFCSILLAAVLAIFLPAVSTSAAVSTAPHDFSPQGIIERRVSLYIEAGHAPLEKLAPAVYVFAADAERCRMASGAEACGLSASPLQGSSLKQIFDYYVAQPVAAGLARQKVGIQKSHWSWRARANSTK